MKILKSFLLLLSISFSNLIFSQCISANHPYNDNCTGTQSSHQAFNMMNIPCAWEESNNGSSDVVIAVMDEYFQINHPDLIGKVDKILFENECSASESQNSHGTSSLGAIAALRNNNFCVAGAGGNIKVAACCQPAGGSNLIRVMNEGYKIIYVASWTYIDVHTAQTLVDNGVVLIIADLGQCFAHLNNIPGVIKVGITYLNGTFFNYQGGTCNSPQSEIDIFAVAEGNCKLITGSSCQPALMSSSLSAGYVAGVVGLMRSVNPCLSPSAIQSILESTAGPIPPGAENGIGLHGIMNAYEAVKAAKVYNQNSDQTWYADNNTISDNKMIDGNLNIVNQTTTPYKSITISGKIDIPSKKDIIIHAGVKLTLTGTLRLGEGSRFIVKRGAQVDINGGVCTTNPCSGQWQGIIVEGNTSRIQPDPRNDGNTYDVAGILMLNNQAIVENARDGISMDPSHIPWPNNSYYGGLVISKNSTIRNCKRGVAFMKYNYTDNSLFYNTEFECGYGATQWANEGVSYDSCRFNILVNGIYALDADINVHKCRFDLPTTSLLDYDKFGINLKYTAPISTNLNSNISNNVFLDGYIGVFKEGGVSGQSNTSMISNTFFGQYHGINLNGAGNSLISNNDFIGCDIGTEVISVGFNENTQIDNVFSNYQTGIDVFFDSKGYSFLNNCFDVANSITRPFKLHGEGPGTNTPVFGQVQNPMASTNNFAAGNCFPLRTFPNNKIVNKTSFGFYGFCDTFTYCFFDSFYCRSVPDEHPNRFKGDGQDEINCNPMNGNPINVGPYYCNERFYSLANLNMELNNILSQIAYYTNLMNNTPIYSSLWYRYKLQIIRLQRCKLRLITIRTQMMADTKSYSSLRSLVANEHLEVKAGVIGAMIKREDYTQAIDYIQEIRNSSQEAEDFCFAQQKLIESYTNHEYTLSSSDKSILYNACKRIYPLSVYSRTIYYKLTGEIVNVDKFTDEELDARSVNNTNSVVNVIKVSPNPTSNFINITSKLPTYKLEVFNQLGKSIISKTLSYDDIVDLSLNHSGVYIFVFKNIEGNIIKTEKIIKL